MDSLALRKQCLHSHITDCSLYWSRIKCLSIFSKITINPILKYESSQPFYEGNHIRWFSTKQSIPKLWFKHSQKFWRFLFFPRNCICIMRLKCMLFLVTSQNLNHPSRTLKEMLCVAIRAMRSQSTEGIGRLLAWPCPRMKVQPAENEVAS